MKAIDNLIDNEAWRSAMRDGETRAALERHWSDIENQDVAHEIYREDVMVEFPQSGERMLGQANLRAMREAYPAKVTATIRRIRGGGALWVTELVITYDGKKQVNAVSIMEFRNGKVARETLYFGDPWEPPAWRAQWVERTR
jgi:SnoaL-like domain